MSKDIENKEELAEENETAGAKTEEKENVQKADGENDGFEEKYKDMNDKYLRLYSEFDNFRKRTAKEKVEIIKTAGEDVMTQLLPVIDDFQRAINSNKKVEDVEAIKEGFELIFDKFFKILEAKGLKTLEAKGKDFDANLHEALTMMPAPSEDQKGKIIEVVEEGYILGEKVIRYPKVVVGQ